MTDRTLRDVIRPHIGLGYAVDVLDTLGVDPDMSFDQFQRWLRWGQRLEADLARGTPDDSGWADCLRFITDEELP